MFGELGPIDTQLAITLKSGLKMKESYPICMRDSETPKRMGRANLICQ